MNKYFYKAKINKSFKKNKKIKEEFAIGSLIATEFAVSPLDFAVDNYMYMIRQKTGAFADWGLPYEHTDYLVIPETIGRFTGVYDINNKPIFVNDMIETEVGQRKYIYIIFEDSITLQIKWKLYREVGKDEEEENIEGIFHPDVFWSTHAEIVGNIYKEEEKE